MNVIELDLTGQIKPLVVVDYNGIPMVAATVYITLRKYSTHKFWNFIDSLWNLDLEDDDAKYNLVDVGSGEYSGDLINISDLNVDLGEIVIGRYHVTKDDITRLGYVFYVVVAARDVFLGVPRLYFPQS